MGNCYLCGRLAKKPLELKSSFTAHSQALLPSSNLMCDRCHKVIVGEWQQCWYWNDGKQKWSKLWSRNWSWLWSGDKLLSPTIGGEREGFPIVSNLPTRKEIKNWLLNPPRPPFTIVIAQSGQKHILPWARTAQSQDLFPVQFELDSIYLERKEFAVLLENYTQLMEMGFSKSEIDSGNYRSDRLMSVIDNSSFWEKDEAVKPYRGSLLFNLAGFVA